MDRNVQQFVIEPGRRWSLNLLDLWTQRELIVFLAWRDISVRYKQTALGALWAILQPALMAVVFTVIFGKMAKFSSDGVPYIFFGYASALCWQYFSTALGNSSASLLGNATLLTKVYFPRLVIPIASVLPACLDFLIAFSLLVVMLVIAHYPIGMQILWLPAFCLLALICALGAGLWFSALSIEYRDVKHVLPFVTQLLLFLSPVAYPASLIPSRWAALYALNPLVGTIEGFRWCVLGTARPESLTMLVSVVMALLLFISGLVYFRAMENNFADVV